jgi:hypothetical protein
MKNDQGGIVLVNHNKDEINNLSLEQCEQLKDSLHSVMMHFIKTNYEVLLRGVQIGSTEKVIPDFYCPKCSYLHSGVTIGRGEKFIEILCFDCMCFQKLRVYFNGHVEEI